MLKIWKLLIIGLGIIQNSWDNSTLNFYNVNFNEFIRVLNLSSTVVILNLLLIQCKTIIKGRLKPPLDNGGLVSTNWSDYHSEVILSIIDISVFGQLTKQTKFVVSSKE